MRVPSAVQKIWFCRNCGWATLRSPSGRPCIVCLKHGHDVRTYIDATVE